jgi:hypothetical protein
MLSHKTEIPVHSVCVSSVLSNMALCQTFDSYGHVCITKFLADAGYRQWQYIDGFHCQNTREVGTKVSGIDCVKGADEEVKAGMTD